LPGSFLCVVGQDAVELIAGADVELGEDLVQVVFDGALAEGHGKHAESAVMPCPSYVADGQQLPVLVVPQYFGGEHA
jgi:hypothetical protein